MQRLGLLRQAPLWRKLTRFEAAKIAPDIAFRNTIGIVVPLIVGASLGYPSTGATGALGALNVCYSDSRDPYILRVRRMLASSVLVAIAVATGSIAGHTKITTVLAAALWAFAAGMMGVIAAKAADVGTTTLVTLVVFAARPQPVPIALELALVAFAGGLLEILLAIASWPFGRYRPERRIVAALYRTLAQLASNSAGPNAAPPGADQVMSTETALASLSEDHGVDAERYIFLLNQAERIRLALLTLRRLARRLTREERGSEASAALERILAMAAAALESMSASILAGRPLGAARQFSDAARQFKAQHADNSQPFLAALIRDAGHQIDALAGQLRAAARLSGTAIPRDTGEPRRLRFTGWSARILANLSLRSTVCRHAVRLAVCVGIGEAIGLTLNLQRSYWLPMTIAIVLKPDFTATFSRGILRIAGTLGGLLVATALFHFLHNGIASDIVLLAGFAFLLRWIGPANYGIFVSAVSAFVVLLIAITGVDPRMVIEARAVNTLIGGALALAAYWLWPTWEHTGAAPVLADLLDAYRTYFQAVATAYSGDSKADLDGPRSRSRIARANAQAFVDRIQAEPGIPPARARLLRAILVSGHAFVRSVMALESGLYSTRPQSVSPAVVDFAAKVSETQFALIQALRQNTRIPRDLPDLRAAHNLIEDHYGLVGVETDRVVNSLNTLREQLAKLQTFSGPGSSTL